MHFKGLHKYKTAAKFQLNLFLLSGVMHINVYFQGLDLYLSNFDPYIITISISPGQRQLLTCNFAGIQYTTSAVC